MRDEIGKAPQLPAPLRQLVDLGVPFAYGEQAPFLGAHVSAVRLTTADDSGHSDLTDKPGLLNPTRLARLGAAAQNLLGSLDAAGAAEVAQGAAPSLAVRGRMVHGWAITLVFIGLLIPFLIGAGDLAARAHRRNAPLAPAFRALRRRLGFWLTVGLLLWFGSVIGLFPGGPARTVASLGTDRH